MIYEKGFDFMTTTELLLKLGFMPNFKGFWYLADAIALYAQDHDCKITALYYSVALRHNTTWKNAERAMRHAIERTLYKRGFDAFVDLLGVEPSLDGGYTLSEFIALCAVALKSENAAV